VCLFRVIETGKHLNDIQAPIVVDRHKGKIMSKESGIRGAYRDATAIVFDWSGTISDDIAICHKSSQMLSARYGIPVCDDKMIWARSCATSAYYAAKRCGSNASEEEIQTAHREAMRVLAIQQPDLVPQIIPCVRNALETLVQRVAGKARLFVVSAHPQTMLEKEVERYGLLSTVFAPKDIYGDCSNKANRLEALRRQGDLDVVYRKTIYVGDTSGDVIAARTYGAVAIAVASGYHDRARLASETPDMIYDNVPHFVEDFLFSRTPACCDDNASTDTSSTTTQQSSTHAQKYDV
jgi:phosphoglycolate phosphatase-like HAD superfamily hydrolase